MNQECDSGARPDRQAKGFSLKKFKHHGRETNGELRLTLKMRENSDEQRMLGEMKNWDTIHE
jgi:hypothetical protein